MNKDILNSDVFNNYIVVNKRNGNIHFPILL